MLFPHENKHQCCTIHHSNCIFMDLLIYNVNVQIFGSIGGVSAGFVLGKEGPMVHTGSCIAFLLGQGGSRKYRLTCTWLRYFKNDRDRRDLITCGAAAGVAAAFRAPVGGVLFALEEVASWYSCFISFTYSFNLHSNE